MGSDNNIYLAISEIFQQFGGLLGTAGPCEIIYSYRHILETGGERAEVLISQDGGWHEHGHLLTISSGLEGCTHGHLGLTKAHIATNQAVHRLSHLHISLHILCGFQLIGRILVKETGLELMLQVAVVTEGETFLTTALGVEFDQIASDILDMLLGALLQALPLTSAQCREPRPLATILRPVFRHLI